MRWILFGSSLLVLAMIVCGCIQYPPGSPATPAPTGISVVTIGEVQTTPHPAMDVTVTARKTADSVVIRIGDCKDTASLTSLNVRVTNYDGTTIQRTLANPVAGEEYTIRYLHTANAATVNIIGTFSDGFQQTLLLSPV